MACYTIHAQTASSSPSNLSAGDLVLPLCLLPRREYCLFSAHVQAAIHARPGTLRVTLPASSPGPHASGAGDLVLPSFEKDGRTVFPRQYLQQALPETRAMMPETTDF